MIPEYITYLSSIRGYSAHTTRAYAHDVRQFARWAHAEYPNARWSTITRNHIDAYLLHMVSLNQAPATTNRALASIASLYNYMIRQGMPVTNPCKYESRRKIGDRIPNTIPTDQLRAAYQASTGRVRAILSLIITTGMRIGEVLSLRWEDINAQDHAIKVRGKGNKDRIVRCTLTTMRDLNMLRGNDQQHGQIFGEGQRQVREMVYDALSAYCDAAQLSPHAIRHTFATHMAKMGANVSMLARQLGHKHLNTTQRYIDMAQMETQTMCAAHGIIN